MILNSYNAILSSACIWRLFKQKIAGAITSFALPLRVLQKKVIARTLFSKDNFVYKDPLNNLLKAHNLKLEISFELDKRTNL